MVDKFEEGELYTNPQMSHDILVLGIAKSTAKYVVLAILHVDRETDESTSHGELKVKTADFKDWSVRS